MPRAAACSSREADRIPFRSSLAAPQPSNAKLARRPRVRSLHAWRAPPTPLQVYGCVRMDDFLDGLAARVTRNTTSLDIFRRLWAPQPEVPPSGPGTPLQTKARVACATSSARLKERGWGRLQGSGKRKGLPSTPPTRAHPLLRCCSSTSAGCCSQTRCCWQKRATRFSTASACACQTGAATVGRSRCQGVGQGAEGAAAAAWREAGGCMQQPVPPFCRLPPTPRCFFYTAAATTLGRAADGSRRTLRGDDPHSLVAASPLPVLQYGSIGWSVGATLGLAVGGAGQGRRVLACIGDGSFQMAAQAGAARPAPRVAPPRCAAGMGGLGRSLATRQCTCSCNVPLPPESELQWTCGTSSRPCMPICCRPC